MRLSQRRINASHLALVAAADSFADSREPPLWVGNFVRLNSGGPTMVIVDIEGLKLRGKAAEFIQQTGVLFVNGLYEAIDRTVADVEPEYLGQSEPEALRELMISSARNATAFRVGKAVVHNWTGTMNLPSYCKRSRKGQASTPSFGKIEMKAIGVAGFSKLLRGFRCSFHRQCILRAEKRLGNA